MMTTIGFTGTRQGMTHLQKQMVKTLLVMYPPTEAHHGDCIGADAEFHKIICDKTSASIMIHPPTNPKLRAFCTADETCGDKIYPKKSYLVRNHDIVNPSSIVIATPKELLNKWRSGTWATIRYARKRNKQIFIIFPDGTVER